MTWVMWYGDETAWLWCRAGRKRAIGRRVRLLNATAARVSSRLWRYIALPEGADPPLRRDSKDPA